MSEKLNGVNDKKEFYKNSLNLPSTDFPQKAKLGEREPEILRFWQENKIYYKMLKQNEGKPLFVFHDGPPYANGHIHYGTILNKILKDFVVKYQNMKGRKCKFIPGWDCHGLPIEIHVEKEYGKSSDPIETRSRCTQFAEKWYKIQRVEFIRLGVFGTWDEPYLTMTPEYEEVIVKSIGAFVKRGAIYQAKKPVYWCTHDKTALAEAEIEYKSHISPSIYVKYPVIDREKFTTLFEIKDNYKPIYVVIWTTTPWTLPASLAIAVHPEFSYTLYELKEELLMIAEYRSAPMFMELGLTPKQVGETIQGKLLENLKTKHPFIEEREIPLVLADYVTLDAGTGCVHTAPGHGQEDYMTGIKYGLPAYAPVDEEGKFLDEVKYWGGMNVWEANPKIVEYLYKTGMLLNKPGDFIEHQYPCCWRCKNPIIFRATPQWFISMDKTGIREEALKEIEKVRWIPDWGKERIRSMMEVRPDWCISRQRVWGVPLPFFHCKDCNTPLLDDKVIEHVATLIGKNGADLWFKYPPEELLPKNTKCKECGSTNFEKDNNIVDVWFESGVSWAAVCYNKPDLGVPVDLYLEGSDQHRGWFHTSLLTGIGIVDSAPYKIVLTHGFVVDEEGKPYSKSEIARRKEAGEKIEYIEPEQFFKEYGAEILRLWTMSEDFRYDIRFGLNIIKGLKESYFKIRNTFRFLLGNISDFKEEYIIPYEELEEIDRWALAKLYEVIISIDRFYENYEYHKIFHALVEFLSVDMSAFYLDILKDRLYCEAKEGKRRRSAQTSLYYITRDLCRAIAPILSFTMEEVWKYIPGNNDKPESVFLAGFPVLEGRWENKQLLERWHEIRKIKSVVNKKLEELRRNKVIGSSLDAEVTIKAGSTVYNLLNQYVDSLNEIMIVSKVNLIYESSFEANTIEVEGEKAKGGKCIRCWNYREEVGKTEREIPEVCYRCEKVIKQLETK